MIVNKNNSRSSGETSEFDSVISSETGSSIMSESLEVTATNRQCQTARKRTFRRNDAKRCQDSDDDIDEEVRTKKLRNYATKTITRVYDRNVSHYSDDDIIILDQEEDAKSENVEPDIVIFDSDQDQGELEEWKTVEIQTARKRTSKPRLSAEKEDKPVVKRVKNVAKKSTSRASSITSNSEDYYDDTESAKSDEPYVATESVEDFNDESDDKYSTKSVSYAKKSTAKSQLIQKLFS